MTSNAGSAQGELEGGFVELVFPALEEGEGVDGADEELVAFVVGEIVPVGEAVLDFAD